MFLNPQQIVDQKLVSGTIRVEPNAIDFTLDSLHHFQQSLFYFSNNKSNVMHRARCEVPVVDVYEYNRTSGLGDRGHLPGDASGWLLEPGTSYDAMSNVYIEVPEQMSAMLVIRSTANRNGVTLTCGLYDSGFKGNIGFALHVAKDVGSTFIEQGTYIGQVIFVASESAGTYSGGYNTKKGEHWVDAINTPKLALKNDANSIVVVSDESIDMYPPVDIVDIRGDDESTISGGISELDVLVESPVEAVAVTTKEPKATKSTKVK
jgi:deoxycytidine triphosphate deaminase